MYDGHRALAGSCRWSCNLSSPPPWRLALSAGIVLTACTEAASTESSFWTAATPEAAAQCEGAFELRTIHVEEVPDTALIRSIVRLPNGYVVLTEDGERAVRHLTNQQRHSISLDTRLTHLVMGESLPLLGVADDGLFVIDFGAAVALKVGTWPAVAMSPSSVALAAGRLFGISEHTGEWTLWKTETVDWSKPQSAVLTAKRIGALEGPAVIASAGGGLVSATLINPPFSLHIFDDTGREIGRTFPPPLPRDSVLASVRALSLGTFALDCGAFLQVIADMRSDARWLVLHRILENGSWESRQQRIQLPGSFVTSFADTRQLFALLEQGGSRHTALFEWSWVYGREKDGL